jgi:hypothetical protein
MLEESVIVTVGYTLELPVCNAGTNNLFCMLGSSRIT